MDASLFKDFTTSRGIKYHYYHSPPADSKPTILFLHGFPSTAYDWRKQAPFFLKKGYGLLIPDLLGYGGTDKPTDIALYKLSKMAADIIDLLDAEKVDKVITVGHDWGSILNSRIANYHQDHFLGFGFAAVGYYDPQPELNIDALLARTKQTLGYETVGYWSFFASEDAEKIVKEHAESFLSIVYTADPKLWLQHFGPTGSLKAWLLDDKRTELAPYMTKEDLHYASLTINNGFASAASWYKLLTDGHFAEDDKQIAKEDYIIRKPVFFAGCKRDTICLSAPIVAAMGQTCPNSTVHEFDADHWITIGLPDEFNEKLLAWIESISATPGNL